MQATVKVTRSGQVSIPYEVREAMKINEGDLVVIDVMTIAKKANENTESPRKASCVI